MSVYWGVGGQYGPFDEQTRGEWTGWPHFGQVMRYFRLKNGMSIMDFARIYGKETKDDGSSITKQQVILMEQEGFPVNINRRKLIARLLGVPPVLFGLATLETVTIQPNGSLGSGSNSLQKVLIDTSQYESTVRTLLTLHYTSHIQALNQMNIDIAELENMASQTRGDLQYHLHELLFSYYLLAAKVVKDNREFYLSYQYANHAVRVARATKDIDLIACGLYTRGRTYLDWGRYGKLESGLFTLDATLLSKAINNFEEAKHLADGDPGKAIHPQLAGLIEMCLSRAYTLLSISREENPPSLSFILMDLAAARAGQDPISDPYQRHLVTGSLIGFSEGEYLRSRARCLVTAGRPGAALVEIQALEKVYIGTAKNFTRNEVWRAILEADIYLGLDRYEDATEAARRALLTGHDIASASTLFMVSDIHSRLLRSPYQKHTTVAELGTILYELTTTEL